VPKDSRILLGYEIGSADPVYVGQGHIIVTGITQKSGKTTAINALANRSGKRILAFVTKPGENAFEGPPEPRMINPYLKHESGWQYVESILEATMGEKMRRERSLIIDASKGARNLFDVDKNVVEMLKTTRSGWKHSMLTNLHAYFEIVLPTIKILTDKGYDTKFPNLEAGINIMDLSKMKSEVQSLIIRSCLEYILQNEHDGDY